MISYVGYFTQLSLHTEASISNYLDEYTLNNNRLRIPSLVACITSTLAALILRVAAVAEDIFRCTISLLMSFISLSPLSGWGWIILEQIPYVIYRVAVIPFKFFIDLVWIFGEPKYFIVESVEYAELHREHLEKNTFGTENYYQDLRDIGKCAYDGLLTWQTGEDETGKGLEPLSRWVKKNLNRRKELESLKTFYELNAELEKLGHEGVIELELYKKLVEHKHLSEKMTHINSDRLSPEAKNLQEQIQNEESEKQKNDQEESLKRHRELIKLNPIV